MKFRIRYGEFEEIVRVIKNTKALGRAGDDLTSNILMEASKEDGRVSIYAYNLVCWTKSTTCSDLIDKKENLIIEESGEVFLDGQEFCNVFYTFPGATFIDIETKEKTKKNKENVLQMSCKKDSVVKKVKFPIKTVTLFEKEAPKEENEVSLETHSAKLLEAVEKVQFATAVEDFKQFLWGVQLEVHGDQILSFASNRERLVFFDSNNLLSQSQSKFIFTPQKNPLVSVVKNLNKEEKVKVVFGEKRTTFIQDKQIHTVPNVVFSQDKMPDLRNSIVPIIKNPDMKQIKIPKSFIKSAIKTASNSSSNKFGIKIEFSSDNNEIQFSIEEVSDSGKSISMYSETISVDNSIFLSPVNTSCLLKLESIKEIVEMVSEDYILFHIKDEDSPIYIYGEADKIGLVSVVIPTGNKKEEPEEKPQSSSEDPVAEELVLTEEGDDALPWDD